MSIAGTAGDTAELHGDVHSMTPARSRTTTWSTVGLEKLSVTGTTTVTGLSVTNDGGDDHSTTTAAMAVTIEDACLLHEGDTLTFTITLVLTKCRSGRTDGDAERSPT